MVSWWCPGNFRTVSWWLRGGRGRLDHRRVVTTVLYHCFGDLCWHTPGGGLDFESAGFRHAP